MDMPKNQAKKHSKRILIAVLAMLLTFGLFGCGANEKGSIVSTVSEPVKSSVGSMMTDSKQTSKNYYTTSLPYTDEYHLIHSTPIFDYYTTLVGLADKNGKVIFNIEYRGIGVTENRYFILCKPDVRQFHGDVYIIIGPDGNEVGRYSYISCQAVNENGIDAYYEASYYGGKPIAPYKANNDYADGAEKYWLLDEIFQPLGESYDSMELFEDGAAATKDGSYYVLDKSGNITEKKEAGVIKTLYDKYQLTIWYISWYDGNVRYGLLDKTGKTIYEQKYCRIEMPFEDRVVLFIGNNQSGTERSASLADANGNMINTQYNSITYLVAKDGYIGIAQSFGPNSEVEIGCKEAGCWLVDKDGKRVSEKYKQIGNYINDLDGWLYINSEDTASPLLLQKEDGTIKTVPLPEVLIPLH